MLQKSLVARGFSRFGQGTTGLCTLEVCILKLDGHLNSHAPELLHFRLKS
jgi:hypothetical protein